MCGCTCRREQILASVDKIVWDTARAEEVETCVGEGILSDAFDFAAA
tara:strand:+ start:179 stop:319 length:141 start_codon:yes stop_codon:yes gene_type:complete